MNLLSRFSKKLSILAGRKRFRSELDEEMAFHREQAERDLIACGTAPEMARTLAARRFGNATRMRERSHQVVGFRAETVMQDLRFALRQMIKNPGYALVAVFILALGMGVSVAIFGFVDAALLQPLPYAHPDRLVSVDERAAVFPRSNLSYMDWQDWKRMNKTLSSLDVYTGTGFLLRGPSGSEPVVARRVSDSFFSTLGVRMMLGRAFLPGEDAPGKPKIVVLTYGTWLKRFSARRNVIGQSVNLSGENYTIVGVLPREFVFAPARDSDFFVPLLDPTGCEKRRSCHNLDGIGRLRDGVTEQQALADLSAIAKQLEKIYPDSNRDQGASMMPLADLIVGDIRPVLLVLLAGAGLLLVIACVNVASLVLVRSESRKREIAVRGALGATPARLTRQFVTEGLLLAGTGCGAGTLASVWIMAWLTRLIPKNELSHAPFIANVALNAHVSAFAAAVGLFSAVLLAGTPTLRLSFQPIRDGLAEGGRTAAGRLWRRMGANLVVVELAVAVVLLAGAALVGQSLYQLLHVSVGFKPERLATVQVMLRDSDYANDAQKVSLSAEIQRRLSALPGVASVALTSDVPVQCACDTDWVRFEGKPFHGEHNEVLEREVSPAYLSTLGATLLRGRGITGADIAGKPRVVVINQTFARKFYPGEDPIGKRIGDVSLSPQSMRQIVGIVADIREATLDAEPWPAEYEAIDQTPDTYVAVAVRTAQDEKTILPVLVSTLRKINPNLGIYGETTMEQQIASTQAALIHRLSTWLLGGFAAIALVLGVVGLYGVIAFSVSQRTREIGVRMALGAQRGQVYRMVLGQAGWLTGFGLTIGLAGSIGTALLMRGLLFGVEAWDAPTLAGVAVVLGLASMAASFLPARRAASVNPTDALRAE